MKILYVATVISIMKHFPAHIKMLQDAGHTVEIAADTRDGIYPVIRNTGCKIHSINFSRDPLSKDNIKAYKNLKNLLKNGDYDLIHTHTPIASAMVRMAARKLRKNGLKVFYTAHGFHFYKGAPLKNWLLYYPVEWLCAHWTDTLITINREDYALAKKHMHAKKVEYVPGVGLDLHKFQNVEVNRAEKRRELGIPEDATVLMSVGELNTNKNHQIVVRALTQLKSPNIHYVIVGTGDRREPLLHLAEECGVRNQLHLLGYRSDIAQLYYVSDICCFPSVREGLGMAALEGMSCGLPIIASDNRGVRDYCKNGENGILCEAFQVKQFADAIEKLACNQSLRIQMGEKNRVAVQTFSMTNVLTRMKEIYNIK